MNAYLAKIYLVLFVVSVISFGCDTVEVPLVCEITDLTVEVGECNANGTYVITVDFKVDNPGNEKFDLFVRNNVLFGTYDLSQLPLKISDFSPSGFNDDYIRVCINDNQECCEEIEFFPPECLSEECVIYDVVTTVGECTGENTYNLTIDFQVNNPGNDFFELWIRNEVYIGYYSLSDLPLTIEHFEMSGLDYDFLNICINDVPNCCYEVEFMPPDCSGTGGDCEIFDLVTEVGDCISTEAYSLTINFEVNNPGNDYFEVYVRNNVLIGYYLISDLPLTIEDFPLSGFDYDYIRVCINDVPDCCIEHEFMPPDC